MADYRKKDTGDVHTEKEIRDNNPNISFPSSVGIQADMVEHLGYELVYDSAMPSASAITKVIVKDGVEQKDGKWYVKWKEIDRHTAYTDGDGNTVTKASQDTAYQAHLDDTQKNALRATRISLLEEADWQIHKIEDADGDSSAWRTYRQQLRDITKASDIYNVTWPTKPS
tara:strand:- start:522 stop:1031 length:510 start_codon:yes stop_codon:yes gene_type:complete